MRTARIEVYRECDWGSAEPCDHGYRWRLRASNGRVIAQSSEGYRRTRDVVHSLELTWPGFRIYDEGWDSHAWELRNSSQRIPITVPDGVSLASRRRP